MAEYDMRADGGDTAPARGERVTLRDIAQSVGVSVSTASRALSGAPGISADMRTRVRSVAERLNYAGTLTGNTTVTVISDLQLAESDAGEFMQAVQRGMERKARELGLNLSMKLVSPSTTVLFETDGGAAGYLLLSMQDEELVQALCAHGKPAVIVNGHEPLMRLDAIAPANHTGGYLAARHLLALGHRRILMLSHSLRPTIRDRMAGSIRALEDEGLKPDADLVVELEAMRTNVAYLAVKNRLESRGGNDFTAIQCCNDACAFGAIAALAEAGLDVPGDVSVIGFDDIPTAALNSVPLTTVRVHAEDIGARSVSRLVERLKNQDGLTTYTETVVEPVVRNSTGPGPHLNARRRADN